MEPPAANRIELDENILDSLYRRHPRSVTTLPESDTVPEATGKASINWRKCFRSFAAKWASLARREEDLETHYNLGIAYREMGLLDEAIGEFQKVAKAVQKGKPFRYAMNCVDAARAPFMDKGEPKIASLWYKRALEVPGLDPGTILALRYDLAVSLEIGWGIDRGARQFPPGVCDEYRLSRRRRPHCHPSTSLNKAILEHIDELSCPAALNLP